MIENQNGMNRPMGAAKEEKSMGAVLGSIIIVIILLVAAFYLWNERQGAPAIDETGMPTAEEVLSQEDPQIQDFGTQSDSDSLSSIEADLQATELDDLTPEISEIDAELGL